MNPKDIRVIEALSQGKRLVDVGGKFRLYEQRKAKGKFEPVQGFYIRGNIARRLIRRGLVGKKGSLGQLVTYGV